MSTFIVYKALIDTYKRLDKDFAELSIKIDVAYALGRLSEEEYTELTALLG